MKKNKRVAKALSDICDNNFNEEDTFYYDVIKDVVFDDLLYKHIVKAKQIRRIVKGGV